MRDWIFGLPFFSATMAFYFAFKLIRIWQSGTSPGYKLWWFVGIGCYGLGTLMEGLVAIIGWSMPLFKGWYVVGAVIGGWPLAQGIAAQLLKTRTILIMQWIGIIWIVAIGALVLACPVDLSQVHPYQLHGSVLQWTFLRNLIPVLNIYSFMIISLGTLYTAYKYFRSGQLKNRFLGNLLVFGGALLPGIGGYFSRIGQNEILYITESIGIVFIFQGFMFIRADRIGSLVNSIK